MGRKAFRGSRTGYIALALLALLVVGGAWAAADRAARKAQLALAARNRALEVELARSAMQEGFLRILEENRILANYSFPEYLRGARSSASMVALLASERESYKESLAYAFFEKPGETSFLDAAQGADAAVEELKAASFGAWERLAAFEGPLVIPVRGSGPEPYFMVFYPARVEGERAGLLGTAVGFGKAILKYLQPLRSGNGRGAFLLSADGEVLWPSEAYGPLAPDEEDSAIVTRRDFRLGDATFSVVGADDKTALLAELRSIEAPRLLVIASGFALVVLALLAVNRLSAAERQRSAATEEGERLAAAVAERERQLAESELRYSAVFEGASDGVLIFDERDVIQSCNPRAAALFGLGREELVGRKVGELSPPVQPDGEASAEKGARLLALVWAEGRPRSFEWTHRAKDGREFIVEVSLAPLDFRSQRLSLAFLRDVTERKRNERALGEALEDRELLLHELHHRVKNNLQFLDSLIELQKGVEGEASREALSKMQSRVSSLAAAYLVAADRPESLKIGSRAYIGAVCSIVRDGAAARGIRFLMEIDCDDIPLSFDVAVPIGLILRELLANAALHGACGDGTSRARLRFSRAGNEALLEVGDWGCGLAQGAEEGLGLTIARALARQLGGSLELVPADPGLVARARFPLA